MTNFKRQPVIVTPRNPKTGRPVLTQEEVNRFQHLKDEWLQNYDKPKTERDMLHRFMMLLRKERRDNAKKGRNNI